MKILLLTQWFEPEPTFKGLLFAKALQKHGHQIEVITGFPNYPQGRLYKGYKLKLYQKELMDGILVNRVCLYPSHDNSKVKRALNYLSFLASATLFAIFKKNKPDVIYVYHPPLTTAVAGMLISMIRRVPFVCDIQDLWPDTLASTGMLNNRSILKVISHCCDWVYSRAAHLVVLSYGFKQRLITRGVPTKKVTVIYNWCDEVAFKKSTLSAHELPQGFNIVFAGNMGHAQALEVVLDAAEILLKTPMQINIVLVGAGLKNSYLRNQAELRKLSNIYFMPQMPMAEVGGVLKAADVLLVHLKRDPLFEITIPSKTQAYMSVGRPLIMAVAGDASDLVMRAGCGVCVEPENSVDLADKMLKLAELPKEDLLAMGQCAKRFYEEKLSLAIGVAHFVDIFNAVLSGKGKKTSEKID